MSKVKSLIESILEMIDSRLNDSKLISSKHSGQNIVTIIYQISSKENGRLRQLLKQQMTINQVVREETNQNISDIGRYLYGVSAGIFHRMNNEFKVDKQMKSDYNGLISLFRKYFIEQNDIRMVTKLQELFRNKSIKKPVILIKLLKILVDVTRGYLLQNIRTANQCITENDVDEYNHQKRQALKQILPANMANSFDCRMRKNTLRVVCPIFMIESVSRFHEQDFKPKPAQQKLDSLLIRRNKLRQQWKQRICNKENSEEKVLPKPCGESTPQVLRKRHFNSVPVSTNTNNLKEQNQSQINTQQNISFFQPQKPSTTGHIFRRTRDLRSKYFQDRQLRPPIGIIKDQKFRDFSGIDCYKSIYGVLNIDEKGATKTFLKKSRKYFFELELKQSLGRNKSISKQIASFKKKV